MVFLKLVHMEYQVNHKTQPFWVKVVYLVPKIQTLAGHVIGTIRLAPTTTLYFDTVHKTKYFFLHCFFFISCKNCPLTQMASKTTHAKLLKMCSLSSEEWKPYISCLVFSLECNHGRTLNTKNLKICCFRFY